MRGLVARKIGFGAFAAAVFAVSSVTSALGHLQLPFARNAVARELDRALASSFAGRVRVEGIESIGLHGLRAKTLVADDPDGVRVLRASNVDLDAPILELATAAVTGKAIVVDAVHVGDANVSLDETPKGMRLARAFGPRKTSSSKSESKLKLAVHGVAIDHAWVHGVLSKQLVDADVDGATGEVTVDGSAVGVDLTGADVVARNLPRHTSLRGRVSGRLADASELDVIGRFEGDAAGVPLQVAGRVAGEQITAQASVPGVSAARIRALAPGAPIHEAASASVFVQGTTRALAFHGSGTLGPALVAASGEWSGGRVRGEAHATHLDVRAFAPSLGRSDARADAIVDWGSSGGSVRGTLDPRGAHATFAATMDPRTIDGDVTMKLTDARAALAPLVPRIHLAGSGVAQVRARFDRTAKTIDATASASLADVAVGPVGAGVLHLDGTASGSVDDPSVSLDALAERTFVPKMHVASARVVARGRLRDARVTARIAANGPFDLSGRVSATPGGAVTVDDLLVKSDGKPILRGAVAWDEPTIRARLTGRDVDLAQIRSTLGLETKMSGTLALDVDASLAGKSLEGRVALDGRKLELGDVRDLDALVDVSNLGGACSLVARARMPRSGWISVESGDLRIDGPSLEPATWERATGTVTVDGTVQLGAIGALRDRADEVRGLARVFVVAKRAERGAHPDVDARVTTLGMKITPHEYALDLDARAHLDPTGALAAHVGVAHGTERATLDGTSRLSWADLLAGRSPDLAALPFTVDLDVPAFDLGPPCKDLGAHCRGNLAAAIHATGPLPEVRGDVSVTLAGFRASVSPVAEIADASIVGKLDRGGGTFRIGVSRAGTAARQLDATAKVQIPASLRAWSASLDARFDRLPVRVPPAVATSDPVKASLSGTMTLDHLHRDARARVDLRADGLELDSVPAQTVTLLGDWNGSTLALATELRAQGSFASFRMSAPGVWGAALAPKLARGAPVRFAARADAFRLRLLTPFLPLSVGSIDGRLDADASGTLERRPPRTLVRGWAKVSGAKIESSELGEIQDLQASLDMSSDGTMTLHDAHFRGTRGKVTLSGRALAPGGVVREVALDASADKRDPFPLVVGGEPVGDVWGRVHVTARPAANEIGVRLDVPSLHVALPSATRGSPQPLAAATDISIGVRDARGELVPVALAPPMPTKGKTTPIDIDVALGNDVRVTRDDELSAQLAGRARVRIAETTQAWGRISLARGMLDVENKRFAIENGMVTFDGDPTNPEIAVTAGWTAPDRTHVTASYVGRALGGKLKLTSDPPHTEDEIVALLVFGSASGPTPSSGLATGAVAAATVAGGASFATEPFNKALEQLTHVEIKTRVDTSGGTAKPEVEVQIAKRLWAEVAYVLGLPPPGAEPDRTWLTLAWHATAHWSLEATVGDHGSTILDALWERRY